MTILEILTKARHIYDKEANDWDDGGGCPGPSCPYLAICDAGYLASVEKFDALKAFARAAGIETEAPALPQRIFDWHDSRKKADSLAVFDRAIAAQEGR